MLDSIKRLDDLLGTEPSKGRIIKTALEGFDAIKTNEIKNQEKTEMEIVISNRKVKFERLRNTLDDFEMN